MITWDLILVYLFNYGFFVLLLVLFIALLLLRGRRRQKAWAQVARDISFAFHPKDEGVWGFEFLRLPLFQRAEGRRSVIDFPSALRAKITNVMKGVRDGREVWLFDYEYASSSGAGSAPDAGYRHTVAVLALQEDSLPEFALSPEGMWQRIFAGEDIDFPSHPDFSRRFVLRGPDESRIRALFRPRVLDALMRLPRRLSVQGRGMWMIVYGPPVRAEPQRIREFLDEALRVFQAFGKR